MDPGSTLREVAITRFYAAIYVSSPVDFGNIVTLRFQLSVQGHHTIMALLHEPSSHLVQS